MTARITVAVDGGEARAALAAAAAAAADLTALMDRIGAALAASTQLRFEDQQSPAGVPWRRSARAASVGGQTLVDTGRLRASITHRPARDRVEVGTNVLYAGTHQFGATIRAKTSRGLVFRVGETWRTAREVTIPPRPFLGLDEADREEIAAISTEWLRQRAQRQA
jgi:phage virion morphogenesis protein